MDFILENYFHRFIDTIGSPGKISCLLPAGLLILQSIAASPGIASQLSTDRIDRHLQFLGSDTLRGRAVGTPGCRRAADYIVDQIRSFGLLPPNGTGMRQKIPMHGSLPLPDTKLEIGTRDGGVHSLKLWSDYLLFNAGDHIAVPVPLPMQFVGYGIVAPEFDYNDYQDLDVANRIVVFLSGEPGSDSPDYFDGPRWTLHADPSTKFKQALARGARGCLMIPDPEDDRFTDWSYWVRQFRFEDVKLLYGISDNLNVMLNPYSASLLFENTDLSLGEIFQLSKEGKLRSFPLQTTASFYGVFRRRDFVSENIVAMVPGTDPLLKDSYVIICAHYDHLGVGVPVAGDSIYNGVGDNGIGTAVTLELARVFAATPRKNKRSLLFVFLTGEEKGLLGSRFYCEHPVVPLYETVAAVNVDGISMFGRVKSLVGVGAGLSTIGALLVDVAERFGLMVEEIPLMFMKVDPLVSSDHYSFMQAGIPSVLIMEGQSYEEQESADQVAKFIDWTQKIYHSPFDDLNQPLDYPAVSQHAMIIQEMVLSLSNSYIAPQWLPGTPFMARRLQSIAEKQ